MKAHKAARALSWIWRLGLLALLAALVPVAVQATPITTLYSTGVDNSNNVLPGGSVDPHYTVSGLGASGPYVIDCPGWNCAWDWVGNTATSAWISGSQANPSPWWTYVYATTFDLTLFNPATAQISGRWAVDDYGDMYLNGNLISSVSVPGWTHFTAFGTASGFQAGINTLSFVTVNSGGGPAGLQVDVAGTAVPEPGTLLLTAGGLLAVWRRRQIAKRS